MEIEEKVKRVSTFVLNGIEYKTRKDAENAASKISNGRTKFLYGSCFRSLERKGINLSTKSTWVITDEGPVDFGSHGGPVTIGYCEGTLE